MQVSRCDRSKMLVGAMLVLAACAAAPALASSHREAPGITESPKVDGTDFYAFRSYETGRSGYVTLVANYIPLQDAYGGPNYFTLDPDAVYEIKVDNDGDAQEDITFQFRFQNRRKDISLQIGPEGSKKTVAIPLIQAGSIVAGDSSALNVVETYIVDVVYGRSRGRAGLPVRNADDNTRVFTKPVDNIGQKTLPDYEAYAAQYLYDIRIPGCSGTGRMFAGQRKDPFVVNLGETFDLVNIANPIGDESGAEDDLADKNVTSLILEVPASCLAGRRGPVIGAWTTASLPLASDFPHRGFGASPQVSRLGSPLVNEVVIGLKDKDKFNASEPRGDAQFLSYVTHPTLPALLELLFGGAGVRAPTLFPRADLVAAFLTGVDGVNKTRTPAEMLRLNTAIQATAAGSQNRLGALECFVNGVLDTGAEGCDPAGFPNGRRPGDDVVDIELRVAMGALLPAAVAPSGGLAFTDGAFLDSSFFDDEFPYLRTPIPGSPQGASDGR